MGGGDEVTAELLLAYAELLSVACVLLTGATDALLLDADLLLFSGLFVGGWAEERKFLLLNAELLSVACVLLIGATDVLLLDADLLLEDRVLMQQFT